MYSRDTGRGNSREGGGGGGERPASRTRARQHGRRGGARGPHGPCRRSKAAGSSGAALSAAVSTCPEGQGERGESLVGEKERGKDASLEGRGGAGRLQHACGVAQQERNERAVFKVEVVGRLQEATRQHRRPARRRLRRSLPAPRVGAPRPAAPRRRKVRGARGAARGAAPPRRTRGRPRRAAAPGRARPPPPLRPLQQHRARRGRGRDAARLPRRAARLSAAAAAEGEAAGQGGDLQRSRRAAATPPRGGRGATLPAARRGATTARSRRARRGGPPLVGPPCAGTTANKRVALSKRTKLQMPASVTMNSASGLDVDVAGILSSTATRENIGCLSPCRRSEVMARGRRGWSAKLDALRATCTRAAAAHRHRRERTTPAPITRMVRSVNIPSAPQIPTDRGLQAACQWEDEGARLHLP